MALYLLAAPSPRAVSPDADSLRRKIRLLDHAGQTRALAVLNGFADHFLAGVPASDADRRKETLARLRACGAQLCVAYLEREGTNG